MTTDILQQVRDRQYQDKSGAEALLLSFIQANFPQLKATHIQLTPLAVSLNSFNGILTLEDGTQRFFKSHTEANTVINEYYSAELLSQAGYPVIQPVFKSTEAGKQLLVYELIQDKSVFDVAWQIEQGDTSALDALTQAQNRADEHLLNLYRQTYQLQTADENRSASIHQLFFHRLTGGRLQNFYGDSTTVQLPHGTFRLADVKNVNWVINGQYYSETLNDIIQRAIKRLNPAQAHPVVVGHGDAHNGNVFFRQPAGDLLYFDPAFAGKHHPLLDLVKPLFHNVFAMWMYYPHIKASSTQLEIEVHGQTWHVTYQYDLHPVRRMLLESKVKRVLQPVLRDLHNRGWLQADWRDYLKSALFCCPFLTMNLADNERFPPLISLLGLAMSVEMGSDSLQKRSVIDGILDEAESALA